MTVNFPDELKSLPYWGYCKIQSGKGGKQTKVPCTASGKACAQVSGVVSFENLPQPLPNGMYYRFSLGGKSKDGTVLQPPEIIILDYDKVIDETGKFTSVELEKEITGLIQNGYVEKSVSGTGFHAILRKPAAWNEEDNVISGDKQPEIFSTDKYVLLTGDICNPDKNNIITNDELLYSILKRQKKDTPQITQTKPQQVIEITPEEARKFTQGLKRIKSSRLWNGIIPDKFAGDRSRAAESLLYSLARVVTSKEEMIKYFLSSPFFEKTYGANPEQEWHPAKAGASYDKAWANRFLTEPTSAPKKVQTDATDLFISQHDVVEWILANMSDDMFYDRDVKTWYVKDSDGYCFAPDTNGRGNLGNVGTSLIYNKIIEYMNKEGVDDTTKQRAYKQIQVGNIVNATIAATINMLGSLNDIAYVFDGGKTLYVYIDKDGQMQVEERSNPNGLRTAYRIHGAYRKCTIDDIPDDMKQFLNGYGSQSFIKMILRICASALPCIPYKPVWQFVSDNANTGKTALLKLFAYSFGPRCYEQLDGKDLMRANGNNRESGLVKAQSKPFTLFREAEGTIQEAVFKNFADNTAYYTGRMIYHDEVVVKRRTHAFMESNKQIKAQYTDAYKQRAYPIEFTNVFAYDDGIADKLESETWKEYGRALVINELFEYANDRNKGIAIEKQIRNIAPDIANKRDYLIKIQDFKQAVIAAVLTKSTTYTAQKLEVNEVWNAAKEYALSMGWKIQEWGIIDESSQLIQHGEKAFRHELEKAGYLVKRTHRRGEYTYIIDDGQLIENIKL